MKQGKIVVFGSYITDLTARAPRFPMAGETIIGSSFCYGPGGKGSNQAVAAHRAGAEVCFITRLGCDFFGRYAREFYAAENMDTSCFIDDPTAPTGAALITVDEKNSQNEIVVIPGACALFTDTELERFEPVLGDASLLVMQLESNMDAVEWMAEAAHRNGVVTVLNPAPATNLSERLLANTDIIIPNETEAELLTGLALRPDAENAAELAAALRDRGVGKVIVTLGKNGFYATDGSDEWHEPAVDYYEVVDTTGAGDAFIGSFSAALHRGLSFFEAARFANVASSLAVTRYGTAPAMPTEAEILWFYKKANEKT